VEREKSTQSAKSELGKKINVIRKIEAVNIFLIFLPPPSNRDCYDKKLKSFSSSSDWIKSPIILVTGVGVNSLFLIIPEANMLRRLIDLILIREKGFYPRFPHILEVAIKLEMIECASKAASKISSILAEK
jgi:hypothetical protein